MNYEKVYYALIRKRQIDVLSKSNGYCELHHIKPVSIYPELRLSKDNIVALTAKEHYVAHHLLYKWYKEKYGEKHAYYIKMLYAFLYTAFIQRPDGQCIFIDARTYEKIREAVGQYKKTAIPWNKGKHGVYSAEYRAKISAHHADVSGKNNPMFGKQSAMYGKKLPEERKAKIAAAKRGEKRSREAVEKSAAKRRGRCWVHNDTTQIRKLINPAELSIYENQGFVLGHVFTNKEH